MYRPFLQLSAIGYRLLRPVLFINDSEKIHTKLTQVGEWIGLHPLTNNIIKFVWRVEDKALTQTVAGITFSNPIGLAAGFDYEAKLCHVLPSLGFGFGTVGTITNKPYEGNPPPRLGRLIKSRALVVNKGFKNNGIDSIIQKHKHSRFVIPIGLSIGKTNSKEIVTQEQAISDIISSFHKAESAKLPFSHYELNISCPNLMGNVEFYSPVHLQELLRVIAELKISKPIFIKMPISETDEMTRQMLDVIVQFPIQGVIFGNLQKNRNDSSIVPAEAAKYQKGYISGKPTEKRSNELIRLAYTGYGNKLNIIGCGGVFSAKDAYAKIKLGASLVQLITGLIYNGPQLPAQINAGLIDLLQHDGYTHISQAVGKSA